jgi:aspartate racemase
VKVMGLIGGLSWESSAEYYKLINELVREKLGGLNSCENIMYSFNFAEIEELQHSGQWDEASRRMVAAAQRLERAGADFLIICSNTMHKMAQDVQNAIKIPLLHIADTTAERILSCNIKRIGLLATRYTMDQDFYKGRLTDKYGLEVIVPTDEERVIVNSIIYDELCLGIVKESSKAQYVEIMNHLVSRGAEGIILGCTEITLLVGQPDSSVPVFDTTRIHAEVAVAYALKG